jgi:LemA protein
VAVILAASLAAGCGYGRIHELDEAALRARAEVEVTLRRRAELVPNLLATVEGYGAAGDELITSVANARASLINAVRSSDLGGMEVWSAQLSEALGELLEAVGRSPDLGGDQGYQLLRSQLAATEEQIVEAGRAYNEAAARFNQFITGFPQLVTAKVLGADTLDAFEPWERPVPLSTSGE